MDIIRNSGRESDDISPLCIKIIFMKHGCNNTSQTTYVQKNQSTKSPRETDTINKYIYYRRVQRIFINCYLGVRHLDSIHRNGADGLSLTGSRYRWFKLHFNEEWINESMFNDTPAQNTDWLLGVRKG